nr:protein kish isoform X1 [Solanum lycopersicum]XP_010318675.1 protein kish isoform X1 [Solanum lycopersicum]
MEVKDYERRLADLVTWLKQKLFKTGKFRYVVLLWICTCTYVKMHFPALLEQRTGFRGFFWKAARIGERLSPWMAVGCLTMGVSIIFF